MVWKHSPAQTARQTGCQVGIQLGRQVGREANARREAEMRVRLSASAIYRDERQAAGIACRLSEVRCRLLVFYVG